MTMCLSHYDWFRLLYCSFFNVIFMLPKIQLLDTAKNNRIMNTILTLMPENTGEYSSHGKAYSSRKK